MAVRRRIFRVLGRSTVGLLIGAFLIGYAAPYLPPAQFWWTDLFALLVPPLGVGAGVVAVALLGQGVYRGAWGRVALAVMLLGLVAIRFGPPPVVGGEADRQGETLEVMTFNVPPSRAQDSTSAARLRQFLRREAPDVLALQEAWIKTDIASRAGLASSSGSYQALLADSLDYAPPRAHPAQTLIHQPVIGRLALDSVSVHSLPPDGETDPRSRYTRTEFRWKGQAIVLYNVHLHTVGTHPEDLRAAGWALGNWRSLLWTYREGALRRAEQAQILRRRIAQESLPVLVVGDFNSTPHQWAYRHIAEGLQRTDRWSPWGRGGTFPAQWPIVRIDHVLAGPAWEIVGTRVPGVEGAALMSDHRPVVARLRWRGD